MPQRPSIPPERYAERCKRAAGLAGEAGLDALLIGVGADLRYLAGYDAMALERLTMLVVPASGSPTLLAPRLEVARARACPAAAAGLVRLVTWEETEDPIAVAVAAIGAMGEPAAEGRQAVAVSDRLWASFVLGFQAALPHARFALASSVIREMRMVKDADEIALLRLAAQAADRVVEQVARGPLVGRTEVEVAREVRERLIAQGHETAAFAIVGSGPNSASPHHEASDRVIGPGEPLVLDIGGTVGGYGSDITRTVWVAGREGPDVRQPDPEFLRLYGVLQEAQAAARAAARPGVEAQVVDAAAREPIVSAGYGAAFMHRTGHGIGLEEHEDPYIVAGNREPLSPGMAFSVEPGIYLEGRYGARIEDIVVCGESGSEALNRASRDLLVVQG